MDCGHILLAGSIVCKERYLTNDLFGITAGGWIGTNNQYNIGPRLIVMLQAIWDKRILKISSGWDVFKSLGVAQTVCH